MSGIIAVRTIPAERFTPVTLADKLKAKVILESSSYKKGKSRYSILLVEEAFRVIQGKDHLIWQKGMDWQRLSGETDILDYAQKMALLFEKQEFPLPCGGVGYLSFEYSARCDSIHLTQKPDPIGVPEAVFIFGTVFIVYDHFTDIMHMAALDYGEEEFRSDSGKKEEKEERLQRLNLKLEKVEERINDYDFNFMSADTREYEADVIENPGAKETFLENTKYILNEIKKGNLLQCVLSDRLTLKSTIPGFSAYKRLRRANPSPYLFYLNFDDFEIFGSSPEVHLAVKGGRAKVRPIAGTRRRGLGEAEDLELEKELLADPKEAAEHLMLVDLARNDLGRVSQGGSVVVTEEREVEYYSHVMHMVSQVESNLLDEVSSVKALRFTFPAGTVSGAPKIRAIETISKLEKNSRSFYAGVIGYVEPGLDGNCDLDTCIAIRCGLKKGDHIYLQAGAGVVYDSLPEREYEETREKLRANAKALGLIL